tara:strand:+ start:13855 stop:14199 length:345 start_codon:yes stop_codon:yes gene_type:complete
MGRYYHGDIQGKFMSAVQSSAAADRFGSTGYTNYLSYYFDNEHLGTINEQLEILEPSFKKVEKFFEGKDSWSTKQQEEAGISSQEISDYADYRLGLQIKECIEDNGDCSFEADL